MQYNTLHPWDIPPAQAIQLQKTLAIDLSLCDNFNWRDIKSVAGIDVGFPAGKSMARAAIAILKFPSLEPMETQIFEMEVAYPYVPGLLSFREIPVILGAIQKLKTIPDVVLCDGQGIAHPRRFGLAAHLGLILDRPAVGVAKSRLTGSCDQTPKRKGEWYPLLDKQNEPIGAVLCTRDNTRPLYVSVGNHISLESAIKLVLACTTRYRLPETTRMAHHLSSNK